MEESDPDHSSEMEARLDEEHHRWLSPKEICDVLRDPNNLIFEKPAITPPSGSIVLYDKKVLRRFRNDGYKWKKAKCRRTKEGHEKLKVKGVHVLHCYYAHKEDDENFQRRIYNMIDKNLSHRVLVHYRDVKEGQIRTGKDVLPSRKTDASAYNHQASSGLPPVPELQHEIGCSSSNPSNFQRSHAPDATNLNSAQTSEPENTISAYNHRASYELTPGLQHEIASSISNPSNFQHSQAADAINFQDFQDFDRSNWGILENLLTGSPDPSNWGSVENFLPGLPDPSCLDEINSWLDVSSDAACTNSSAAVEPSHSSLGKRQCDSTKSKATPLAAIEGIDEEEEGNDTNQARKRLKVTRSQKSHEFSEVAVMGSCKSLRELVDRASAPNTLASSSISTPTIDSQAIATIRTTLEMDFTSMAGDVQRNDKISHINSLVNCFPTGSRTSILPILKQLKQSLRAYSEYDKGKNLNAQVEDKIKRLQPKVQFCESRKRDLQRLENEKMSIEAKQAVIRAEIDAAVKETEPIQAELKELLPQRDQFKENEGNLKTNMDIGDCFWTTLKKVISRYLPL